MGFRLLAIRYLVLGSSHCSVLCFVFQFLKSKGLFLQVQHSVVDMRPQQKMAELCQLTGVKLITYLSLSQLVRVQQIAAMIPDLFDLLMLLSNRLLPRSATGLRNYLILD